MNERERVRLAIQDRLLPGASLLERYENARRYGFDAIELSEQPFDDAVIALRSHIPISAICGGYRGWLIDPDLEQVRAARKDLARLIELAGELGCGCVVVPIWGRTRNLPNIATGRTREEDEMIFVDGMTALASRAERVGALLYVEPINRYQNDVCNTVADALRLRDRIGSNAVRVMADVFHMNVEEADMAAAVASAGDWLGYLHLADSQRLEPGKGHLDFGPIFAALARIAYRGYVVRARDAFRRCRVGTAGVGVAYPREDDGSRTLGDGGTFVSLADRLAERGEIGGRTVRITEAGEVECHQYPVASLDEGMVRIRTAVSAISPGTEMTYVGRDATNPYLRKRWDPELRLFVSGEPTQDYPIVFGYRAAGIAVESRDPSVAVGTRIFGKWRHTEFTTLPAADARAQILPDGLSFDDGVDLAQMLPIAVNAVAYAEERHKGSPAVVFGCGPVGLITAQVAHATGGGPVYAVDRLASRLKIAGSLGLVPLDASTDDVALRLKREHGADAIPVAFECTGNARVLHEAIRVVRRRGAVIAVGFYQGDALGLFLGDEFHHNGVEVRSGQIGNLHPRWEIAALRAYGIGLALRGDVILGALPRVSVPVERAADAFAHLGRPDERLQVAFSYEDA